MPARSGAEYIESLRKQPPRVFLGGRRIADVTAEPVFQEPIRAIAEQYDMQLDPGYRDVMTYPSPTTGQPVSTSFLVPLTREELVKKRKHFKLRAVRDTGGSIVAVQEAEIVEALRGLARQGLYVEPTSAVAAAGLSRLLASGVIRPQEYTVLVLTGSGLKAGATTGELLKLRARTE